MSTSTTRKTLQFRIDDDRPIRFLLAAEAFSNVIFLLLIFLFPSAVIEFLFQPAQRVQSLTIDFLFWWASWLLLLTIFMFIVAVRPLWIGAARPIYWILLTSEVLLAFLLVQTNNRTKISVGFAVFLLFIVVARLFVLFVKRSWFGELERIKLN